MSKRLNIERQNDLEPQRIEYAIKMIEAAGIPVQYQDEHKIQFIFKRYLVTLYPFSGWFTGKSVTDGRGIQNLLTQLK